MKTELLMRSSALVMGCLGIVASFLPQELLSYYGAQADWGGGLVIQVLGALYLGFAVLNWMARSNLIGGIYSRPVALGNFLHFVVGAVTLLKVLLGGQTMAEVIIGFAVYSVFAVWFGFVVFTHPMEKKVDPSVAKPDNRMESTS